jgi:hypothetical protein
VAVLAKLARKLRSDETGTAYDDNLHDFPSIFQAIRGLAPETAAKMRSCGPESLAAMLNCD